jgi:hypothetical protein
VLKPLVRTDGAERVLRAAEAEAEALHAAAVEKWQEAARVAQLGKLTDARDFAQAAVDEHKREQQVLEALLADAESAEDAAAAALEPQARARGEIGREVELAVSMKHGLRAVNRARERLRDAAADLKPYQDALEEAARRRRQAGQKVAASVARADQPGRALTDAESELASPPPAPMSPRAVQASPFLLLIRGTLDHDPAALEMARETGRAICDQTGATSEIIAESRAELLAEQDTEFRRTPLMVGRGPGGQRTARPKPYHAGNPQP